NVILFGETGVGKSSVINLIAGKEVAKVSSDVDGCTMASTPHPFALGNRKICIFDTVGLEEPQMGVNGYLAAIEKTYELIQSLSKAGGVHLLLFCMRGGRITATVQSNYRLFCEFLCNKQVPIALIFTGLEREERMEAWWERNEKNILNYGIRSVGHACITAVRDDTSGQDQKYQESAKTVRKLLTDYALEDNAFLLEGQVWLVSFGRKLVGLITKKRNPKQRDLVKVLTKRCSY
ncbi:P-loop containing nucleoside triphosphate hydrolase protein, partial [Melanogaster broomeanus]